MGPAGCLDTRLGLDLTIPFTRAAEWNTLLIAEHHLTFQIRTVD